MKKRLIASYDEINDTFVGKVDGEFGFSADYGISDGIFLGINKYNIPTSIFVPNASKALNTSKNTLECADVKILIDCDDICLYFSICIEDLIIYSTKCFNSFNIPNINFLIDSNY